jgi:hypothetical protein
MLCLRHYFCQKTLAKNWQQLARSWQNGPLRLRILFLKAKGAFVEVKRGP